MKYFKLFFILIAGVYVISLTSLASDNNDHSNPEKIVTVISNKKVGFDNSDPIQEDGIGTDEIIAICLERLNHLKRGIIHRMHTVEPSKGLTYEQKNRNSRQLTQQLIKVNELYDRARLAKIVIDKLGEDYEQKLSHVSQIVGWSIYYKLLQIITYAMNDLRQSFVDLGNKNQNKHILKEKLQSLLKEVSLLSRSFLADWCLILVNDKEAHNAIAATQMTKTHSLSDFIQLVSKGINTEDLGLAINAIARNDSAANIMINKPELHTYFNQVSMFFTIESALTRLAKSLDVSTYFVSNSGSVQKLNSKLFDLYKSNYSKDFFYLPQLIISNKAQVHSRLQRTKFRRALNKAAETLQGEWYNIEQLNLEALQWFEKCIEIKPPKSSKKQRREKTTRKQARKRQLPGNMRPNHTAIENAESPHSNARAIRVEEDLNSDSATNDVVTTSKETNQDIIHQSSNSEKGLPPQNESVEQDLSSDGEEYEFCYNEWYRNNVASYFRKDKTSYAQKISNCDELEVAQNEIADAIIKNDDALNFFMKIFPKKGWESIQIGKKEFRAFLKVTKGNYIKNTQIGYIPTQTSNGVECDYAIPLIGEPGDIGFFRRYSVHQPHSGAGKFPKKTVTRFLRYHLIDAGFASIKEKIWGSLDL